MDSATGPGSLHHTGYPQQHAQPSRLLLCQQPALLLTVYGVRPMATTSLRSVTTCSTPRSSKKPTTPRPRSALARASHSKPSLQMPHLQSLLVKQVASCPLQTSSLINTGTQTQGPCATDTAQGWFTHYKPHHIQLGNNSIVWSEGIGVCWFEPLLEGNPGPLVQFSNVLYIPCLAPNVLSLFSLTAQLHFPWYWLLPLLQQGSTRPVPGHSHRLMHWPTSRSHPTCTSCTPYCLHCCCCATHSPTLALAHQLQVNGCS